MKLSIAVVFLFLAGMAHGSSTDTYKVHLSTQVIKWPIDFRVQLLEYDIKRIEKELKKSALNLSMAKNGDISVIVGSEAIEEMKGLHDKVERLEEQEEMRRQYEYDQFKKTGKWVTPMMYQLLKIEWTCVQYSSTPVKTSDDRGLYVRFPCVREIGMRSDGTVTWRKAEVKR